MCSGWTHRHARQNQACAQSTGLWHTSVTCNVLVICIARMVLNVLPDTAKCHLQRMTVSMSHDAGHACRQRCRTVQRVVLALATQARPGHILCTDSAFSGACFLCLMAPGIYLRGMQAQNHLLNKVSRLRCCYASSCQLSALPVPHHHISTHSQMPLLSHVCQYYKHGTMSCTQACAHE